MMRSKILISSLLLAAVLFAAGCGGSSGSSGSSAPAPSQASAQKAQAPGFTLKTPDGTSHSVQPGDGRIYVINFWATWCPPCRSEMPEMDAFAAKYKDKITFYGVDLQEDGSKVKAFLKENGYTLPVLLDQDGKAGDLYHVRAIPTTVVLDEKGNVLTRHEGMITARQLEEVLKGKL